MRFFLCTLVAILLPLSAKSEAQREIHSQYHGGLIWLKVDVTGKSEPLNFLLDSGAGITAIDLQTARSLSAVQLGQQGFKAVTTGVHTELIFSGEAGLLGNGLLSKFRLTIDEPGNTVIFENPILKSQGASLRTK